MSKRTKPTFWNRLVRSPIALPLALGLLVRLMAFPLAHLKNPELPRHWEYATIALNLASGKGYSFDWSYLGHTITIPTVYMLPGEVMVHFAALGLFGDTLLGHTVLFLEEVGFGGIFIFAMWKLLTLLFGNSRRTRIGVWLAALYPSFVVACASYGITSAVLALDALFLWLLLLVLQTFRSGARPTLPAMFLGIIAGLLTQFRSESYLLLSGTAITILWLYRKSFRNLIPLVGVTAIAMAVICAPWVIRNYLQFHKVIITSVNGGFNFWRGNTFGAYESHGHPMWTTDGMWNEMAPGGHFDSSFEFTRDAYHWHAAFDWIRTHPQQEVVLAFDKLGLFWGFDTRDNRAGLLYIILYVPTVIAAIIGLIRLRKEKASTSPTIGDLLVAIAVWAILYSMIVAAFFSLERLQVLMIGFYFPLVVVGTDWIIQKFSRNRNSSIPVISNYS